MVSLHVPVNIHFHNIDLILNCLAAYATFELLALASLSSSLSVYFIANVKPYLLLRFPTFLDQGCSKTERH